MGEWGLDSTQLQALQHHFDAAQWAQSAPAAEQAWPQQNANWTGGVVTPAMKAKGVGKAPGASMGGYAKGGMMMTEDPIYVAINTAMANVPPEELVTESDGAWDPENLKRRIAKYFKSAAKGLSFSGGAEEVINQFADNALGNVSWALQGTKWLNKADFTLVLEIAISELFPEEFKAQHPGHALEEIILKAHDRALEDALFAPVLLETVKELVEGKKSSNKVHNAAEAARRELVTKLNETQDDSADFHSAFENGVQAKIEEFVGGWIRGTLKLLGEWPDAVMDRDCCTKLFQRLVVKEDVCLPRSLVRYMVEPLPEDWEFLTNTIAEIYDAAEASAEASAPAKKKKKTASWADYDGPNFSYKTEVCRNIAKTGYCKMGDWCVFAHDESELYMHRSGAAGPGLPYGKGHAGEFAFAGKGKKKGFVPSMLPYGKGSGPMCGGKGKPMYGKGGYGSSGKGYGKSGGKRSSRYEPEEEEALEEDAGDFDEVDEEGGLGPGAYAREVEE